jgi:putative membrane protein
MMLLWLVLLGVLIYLIMRWAQNGGGLMNSPLSAESALEILKKRYVKGEISKEEFESKKRDINQ